MSCLWQISKIRRIMMDLRLPFICIGVGQGNSYRGPEEFVRNEALSNF